MTKEDVCEIMQEIRAIGKYSDDQIIFLESALEEYLTRRYLENKYYDLFAISTGKKYGDAVEARIIKSFRGFRKPANDSSFDALTENNEKVEIKSLRACSKGQKEIFSKDESVSSSRFSTSSYQQTKPSCCDWFVYHILYRDGSRLFVIPSSMISRKPGALSAEDGKIPLSVQHRNHETEGQVNLGQVIKYADVFEIKGYELENTYEFEKMSNEVTSRLEKIGWHLTKLRK